MKRKQLTSWSIGLTLLIAVTICAAGCGKIAEVATGGGAEYNGKRLTHTMSDAEILDVFGIELSRAESKRSQGPDGYTTLYTHGEQRIGITRSRVTGVYVYADGPIKGDWRLGGEK